MAPLRVGFCGVTGAGVDGWKALNRIIAYCQENTYCQVYYRDCGSDTHSQLPLRRREVIMLARPKWRLLWKVTVEGPGGRRSQPGHRRRHSPNLLWQVYQNSFLDTMAGMRWRRPELLHDLELALINEGRPTLVEYEVYRVGMLA